MHRYCICDANDGDDTETSCTHPSAYFIVHPFIDVYRQRDAITKSLSLELGYLKQQEM